ncbi:MAG: phosphoribosylanthranilate isomerase [Acidobacteriaceae bacterium]|nr:phosphoribosylanthranilate isomerase [Acidobacteriaceae bacterium]MBV8570461.1 phosphoribosylanthranilate isomerase [Acidobacteriaceae bacterium]
MNANGRLPFVVKVCGITNAEDVLAAVEAGANALGFNFYEKSPRAISPDTAREIAAGVPAGVLKVGVFVNCPPQRVHAVAAMVPLDVVQLHGERASGVQLRTWRAVAVTAPLPLEESEPEAYLLDSYSPEYGGSGRTFDWRLARNAKSRLILAGGLDGANVARAVETARPWGVDACSRLEVSPGRKDPRRVRDFVEAAVASLKASVQSST